MDRRVRTGRVPTNRSLLILKIMIAYSVASTTVHYTHNFIYASEYPPVPLFFPNDLAYRIGIAVFYPLLTIVGIWGYFLYRQGRWRDAVQAIAAYALLGFTTIFHYAGGVPRIPALFTVTIYTDFTSGSLLLGFSLWLYRTDLQARRTKVGGSGSANA